MTGRLQGQTAIVTGAGTGIGRACAVALTGEGARVLLVGRRTEPLQETAGMLAEGTAVVYAADLTDESACEAVAQRALSEWGRIDILVNNAGINVPARDLEILSVEDWRRVIDADLNAPFMLTRATLPAMRERRSGTIINVSSAAGLRPSALSGPAYGAAKHALNAFTESINLVERPRGIRACAVCPGEVETPIMDLRPNPPSVAARATMLQPEDVADAVLLVAALPPRALVDLISIRPTFPRDVSEDRRNAQAGAAPSR